MTILCGWRGVTVPAAGTVVKPLTVTLLEVKVTGVLLVLCSVMVCEPGDCAPCTAAKIRPAGCTMAPTLEPGGSTVRTTDTNCGLLVALADDTFTVPKYVPAVRPVGFSVTPTAGTKAAPASVWPLWGNTESQEPPEMVLVEMVQGMMPVPALRMLKDCSSGAPPPCAA